MADIFITVVSGETTNLALAVPGVQGPMGLSTLPSGGTTGQIIIKESAVDYDAAWTSTVSGLTLQGATRFALGSSGSPSITFSGDPNTGIYSPGADQVAISTGGTGRLFVGSTGNTEIISASSTPLQVSASLPRIRSNDSDGTNTYVDFYANSGTAFVDSRNDAANGAVAFRGLGGGVASEYMRITPAGLVGVGTASPASRLEAVDTNSIIKSRGSAGYGSFYAEGSTGNGAYYFFGVNGAETARLTSDSGNYLAFGTGSSSTERVRITSDGKVGIGTSAPGTLLHVSGTATTAIARIANTDSGSTSFDGSGAGLELIAGNSNLTDKYAPAIKFGSTDSEFTTTNPKFGAALTAEAAQTYSTDTTGGMDLAFWTAPANPGTGSGLVERMRIRNDGRLLIGISNTFGVSGLVQVQSTSPSNVLDLSRQVADTSAPRLTFTKTRGSLTTSVVSGDGLGTIRFHGSDGTNVNSFGASIESAVDGTPGTNSMPGRLVFGTTADGASSPTERLRITNDGVQAYNQPAPAAVNATATLTVANLKAGIITSTSAAATDMTLPTGTDTQAGFSGTYDNFTFEWSVINTGPSLVRVLAGTAHTIVGSGSVATGTSGRFASRRTAANTFVTYRLS